VRYRTLGTRLRVSAVGFGGMGLAALPTGTRKAVVGECLDRGVTLFDTADYYGQGADEEALGQALGRRGTEAVISTKTGVVHQAGGPARLDGTPAGILAACDGSLKRLGVERIGLYLLARVDPAVPVEDSVGAMAELAAAGKVDAIGLCEASPGTVRRAHAVHPIAALQTEYSLLERGPEGGALDVCDELGIGFIAYRPLCLGLLACGPVDPAGWAPGDWRRRDPRFHGAALAENRRTAAGLAELGPRFGMTPAAAALAWVLSRGDNMAALPGTRRREHAAENAEASCAVMSLGELDQITARFSPGCARGERYAPGLMAMIDRSGAAGKPRTIAQEGLA
jgi:aryl-alcohol dehydrogenase-like predicted oxidoreductase